MRSDRIIVAALALFVLLLVLTGLFVYSALDSDLRARTWVAHTHEVIEQNHALFSSVQSAESAERGLLLSGNRAFLEPFDRAAGAVPAEQLRLRRLVSDNPGEVARVEVLNRLVARRIARLRVFVDIARSDMQRARAKVGATGGLVSMTAVEQTSQAVNDAESALLKQRVSRASHAFVLNLIVGVTVALLALIGLLAAAVSLNQSNRQLRASIVETLAARASQETSDALVRAIFANSPDYLVVLEIKDGDRFVVGDVNPAFERAINTPAAAIRGRSIEELVGAKAAAPAIAHYRRVRDADAPILTRDVIPGAPGGPRTWESILAPVKNTDGVTERIIGSIRDITERVNTEARLAESQRMEAIGHLTGGVAHDFNNLLQVIRGNLELLENTVADDARASRQLSNAVRASERAAQLTRQLLAFARRQPLEPEVVNLARLVGDMADLLRRTLGETIEVETVIGGGLWNTLADPAQVESAILNLALNSRDAMPEGGRLTVEVANAALDEAYVRGLEGVAPGQYVLIAVSDTGQGMSPQTRDRAFEPFFTTKGEHRGSGLGLSMVYGFVRQTGGHVRIYSEPGHGTSVKLYLPRSRREVAPAATSAEAPPAQAGRTILVVEDEPDVRAAAVAMLQDLGYLCLEAGDAAAALEVLGDGVGVDLVFTDVVMPGALSTRDFTARAKTAAPHVPILFTSGYTENAIVHHGRLDEGVSLLPKPYARSDLARKIAQLLPA